MHIYFSEQNDCKVNIEKLQIEKNVSTRVDKSKNVYNYNTYNNCTMVNNGNIPSSKQHASSSSANGYSAENSNFDHRMQNLKSFQTSTEESSSRNADMDYLTSNRIEVGHMLTRDITEKREMFSVILSTVLKLLRSFALHIS